MRSRTQRLGQRLATVISRVRPSAAQRNLRGAASRRAARSSAT